MIQRTEQEIMKDWKGDVTTPLVSICTITYNHEQYIAEALDSFLMQETDFPFEIVIDDDCSTDINAKIIQSYIDKYPNIFNANLRSMNVGMNVNGIENLQRATGKYIALCEGDDYWTDPLKLQIQINFLEENTNYVISGHDAFIVDENGNHLKDSKLPDIQKKDFDGEDLVLINTWILTLSWVFRKEAIAKVPHEILQVLNGDNFLLSIIGHFGKSKYHNDIKPAGYRSHLGGIWSRKTAQEKLDALINTNFWIYCYYNRINEEKNAKHFLLRYQRLVISSMENDFIIKELFKKLLRLVKSFMPKAVNIIYK